MHDQIEVPGYQKDCPNFPNRGNLTNKNINLFRIEFSDLYKKDCLYCEPERRQIDVGVEPRKTPWAWFWWTASTMWIIGDLSRWILSLSKRATNHDPLQ